MTIDARAQRGASLACALVIFSAFSLPAPTGAQGFPNRPIRVIVPYAAGGAGDRLIRVIGQKLGESWGQPLVVDNRVGGATNIGSELAAKSPSDGYTLLLMSPANAVNVSLYGKMPYDPINDFAPVTLIDAGANVLVVHPSLPVKSVKELIALAKAKPGQLNYGSSGIAGSTHLSGALFNSLAKVNIVHVPYKGFALAISDLMSGQITMYFSSLPSGLPLAKAGRLKALAVTSAKRSEIAPTLPTIAEAGLRGYEITVWHGLSAPIRTPGEVIARLNSEIVKVLAIPEVKKNFESQGLDVVASSPADYAAFLKVEINKYAQLIKSAGITPE